MIHFVIIINKIGGKDHEYSISDKDYVNNILLDFLFIIKFMQQMMIRILLLLMATPLICYTEGIPNSIRSEALLDQTAFQSNE